MTMYHDYAGVIHIHSTYSDGLKKIPDIIQAANEAGCNYMILSDHDTLKGLSKEGWYNNTILLVGEEITIGEDEGHYLAMGFESEIAPHNRPQETIDEVKKQGGIGFIAHPYNKSYFDDFNITSVKWNDWNVIGFNGIEIWNYSHDWIDNFTPLNFLIGLSWPDNFIDGPLSKTLKKWDELLRYQKIIGIGSVDAHGYFYSYKKMFETLHTHLLLEKTLTFQSAFFKKDKSLVYEALKKGNCYLSYDYLANAAGFMYSAKNMQKEVIMGDELNIRTGVVLTISTPEPALLKVIKDGQIIAEKNNTKLLVKKINEPGAYRAEVYLKAFRGFNLKYRPWIFSNPIYIY
ncbi:hypothetical protein GM661_01230 [Iocasia frigidifontis]|uniref:Polymerase/histidinol phosphatase N-terminal domain-containing protein n=1 Tax=Iocasia fonsfrigidae TaxID=2682810 RepID=A0A8A7K6A4_9FIRM|nr:PHP domain-containing protein [Iocasia fonsfrigidae]QTL96690.1 hypothetical protein GM661_01230 [Iocasia fonsfrigidae]